MWSRYFSSARRPKQVLLLGGTLIVESGKSGSRKLAVVHRGKAFRAFRKWLEEIRLSRG